MEALTPGHLAIILIAFLLLAGYKKLPDAARSTGRSLRIFRSEMRALDNPVTEASGEEASAEELEAAAAEAERHAAELRARLGERTAPS